MRTPHLFIGMLLLTLLWNPQLGNPSEHGAGLPKTLIPSLAKRTKADWAMEKRIASVLQKLPKTLILESTRGVKDIQVYKKAAPAVVLVFPPDKTSYGSGAIIDASGHVMTNWHVVKGYSEVVVVFKPRDSTELKKELAFRATVEKVDQVTDLALLRINNPPRGRVHLKLGEVSTLAVGQDVHAIGHPLEAIWTYTKGIISQIRGNFKWTTGDGDVYRANVIQTQTPINPGNSGGPLLDDNGRLIGVNSWGYPTAEGLNFAVAVDEVRQFLKKKSNRVASSTQSGVAAGQLNCPEVYEAKGKRRAIIKGCYYDAKDPPPHVWLVTYTPNQVDYGALGSRTTNEINTLVLGLDKEGVTIHYFVDTDCDGTVNIIGSQHAGSNKIDSYRQAKSAMRLDSWAPDLNYAIKHRIIPYSGMRLCQ